VSNRIPIFRLKLVQDRSVAVPFVGSDAPAQLLAHVFSRLIGNADREHVAAIFFGLHGNPLGVTIVGVGSLSEVLVQPREVFKCALLCNATSIVVSHNHPSGSLTPSEADIACTRRLSRAGELLGVEVRDHVIVTPCGFTSFREAGLMSHPPTPRPSAELNVGEAARS
jgi:DNA repair protein RadC